MKKIIAALLVLAVAAPAFATTVTATQISGNEVEISYDASSDPCLVRAFGFDIIIDSPDVTISETNDTSADYWVFPGTITFSGSGISSYGTPVAEVGDNADTQPGLDSNAVTLEMASLYESSEPAPAATGDLIVLAVDANLVTGPGTVNLTMADNGARGGIVLEDGSSGSAYNGTTLYLSTLNRDQYATWLAWGGGNPAAAPANWCGWCWKCGDVDNNGLVSFGDVIATFGYFKDATSVGEGDTDMNGLESFGDVITAFNNFKTIGSCAACLP